MTTISNRTDIQAAPFEEPSRHELAPLLDWNDLGGPGHVVQFYETDSFLLGSVERYVSAGLAAGDACVLISTEAHREGLEARLRDKGLDVAAAEQRGDYYWLGAQETLAQLMEGGAPRPDRFSEIVGGLVARAGEGNRHVRVFGEMVEILWLRGQHAAAIELEELWNNLYQTTVPFSLLCAYSTQGFAGEANGTQLAEVCRQHARVIPDESYTALASSEERLLAITLLQQKADSLPAEIAERKAAVERMRISENRYRRLFEASTDGILIVDPTTHTVDEANPVMTKLLGRSLEDMVGQELWQIGLFPDRDSAERLLCELEQQRFVRYDTMPIQANDGQQRYVEFVSTRFRANGHDVIQCNLRDITERKLAEDERKQLEERKNAFISMASHELKTPVTSLKGFTQILQRRLQQRQADPEALLFLNRMNAQLTKLTHLIGDLLDISKMESGTLAFRESVVDLDALVHETVENVQAAVTSHHIEIRGETHAQVFGDQDRLEQVLVNLLTNAIKYSPEADTVLVHLTRHDDLAEIAVQDFGIGIAPEHHERVFERFYQVADQEQNTYPGLGIGLFIARSIVERHDGHLWIESDAGAGSTFRCTLPLLPRE